MGFSFDRIAALSERVAAFAGRRMDALAKPDPVIEMARIQVDHLRWRLQSMAHDLDVRTRSGILAADDIQTALSRMARAIGRNAGDVALLPLGAMRHHGRVVASLGYLPGGSRCDATRRSAFSSVRLPR